jgi:hypothetical protein
MKQHYFVVVLAHSLHGRLRRIHVPHHALYVVLGLALLGSVSLFGAVSSYVRMALKVANYNTLRSEVETLRTQYKELERQNTQKEEQLASLQVMASEVSLALGLKRRIEGADDISLEGALVPSYTESIEEYNFLKAASFSRGQRTFARKFQKNIMPSMWPVNGQIASRFGDRADPLNGEGGFHAGVDLTATMGHPFSRSRRDCPPRWWPLWPGDPDRPRVRHDHLYAHLSKLRLFLGKKCGAGN